MDDCTFLLSSLLPSLEFAFEVESELLCDNCGQAAISSWRVVCNHLLCWRCMNEIMRGLQKCPLDATPIIIGEAKLQNDVDEAVRKLPVRCPYQKQGCSIVMALGKITEHMNVCNYLPVYCPRECGHTVSRKNIVQHIVSSCPGVQEQQRIKRMASLQNIKTSASQMELFSGNAMDQDKGIALIELQSQVDQLNQNVNHFIQHGHSKSTTAIYSPALAKRRSSKPEMWKAKHKSMSELEIIQQFDEMGSFNNVHSNEFEGQEENCVNKLLEMTQLLTQRADDSENKMVTKDFLNQVAGTILDRIEVFQSSLRIHYKKLEVLEVNQKRIEDQQTKTYEICEKASKHVEELITQLDEFNRKLTAQHQAWIKIVDHMENPWLKETQNGMFIWKIGDYAKRKLQAIRGIEKEVYSPPFFTHMYGYRLCLRAYLNGYFDGEGSHLSVYICVMKGPFDDLLIWPFKSKFTFSLLDQKYINKKDHLIVQVDPKKMGHNFTKWCQKPEGDRNVGFGIPEFISHAKLEKSTYLQNDSICLKVVVDLADSNDKK